MPRHSTILTALLTALITAPWASPAQDLDPRAVAEALSQAFSSAADRVQPAVVNISTTKVIPGRRDPFADLFGNFFGSGALSSPDREVHSLGSGVIIRPDGYIVTNYHVVRGAQSIVVALGDAAEVEGTVRGSDPASDLAVVKVDGINLPCAEWGDSDALRVGEWVIAIGSPLGLRHSVTSGIVSAKSRRDVGIATVEDFIQTDATINPGNSGGALANLQGELVGIPTAIFSKSGGYEGVGFAIPSKTARPITDAIIDTGRYERGWVGVIAGAIRPRLRELAGLDEGLGLLVDRLYRDSPVDKAGIAPGDVIVRCNGEEVTGLSSMVQAIEAAGPNGTLEIDYIRLEQVDNRVRRVSGSATVGIVPQPVDDEGRAPEGI